MSENFLQHAEHYQRILIQAAAMQEQSRRESADAATDFDGDGDGPDAGPESRPAPVERQAPAQPRHETTPAGVESAGQTEIGGMTMIDSGSGGDDLLVVPEEITQSQPRRNGDGRRRRQRAAPAEAPEGEKRPAAEPETQAQPEN
jgi:hypothetical protein